MKLYRSLILACLLLSNFFSFGQIGYDTLYTKEFGNPLISHAGNSLIEQSNDNLLLSTSYDAGTYCNSNAKLYTINKNGDSTWSKLTIPGKGPVRKTRDGNFINVNTINYISRCEWDTIRVSKFKLNGDTLWTRKFYLGIDNNRPSDIIQTQDNGYAITGYYSSLSGGASYISFVIKLDANGATQWIKHLGTHMVDQLEARTIVQTSNGEYGVFCYKPFFPSTYRLIKLKANGDMLWTRDLNLNGVAGYGAMTILPNDDFIVAGATSNLGITVFSAKIDKNGVIKYYKEYPFPQAGGLHVIGKMIYLPNHNACLFGSDRLFLIDTAGTLLWTSMRFVNTIFYDIIQTENKDIAAIGTYSCCFIKPKIFYVRFKDTTAVAPPPPGDTTRPDIKIYPNPTRNELVIDFNKDYSNITLQLFNMLGQRLINDKYYNTRNIHVFLNRLPAAVYVLRIFYDDKKSSIKIIKYQ